MRDWDWLRPHTLNLYEYVGNDPVNGWDPDGYFWNELKNWFKGDGWKTDNQIALQNQGFDDDYVRQSEETVTSAIGPNGESFGGDILYHYDGNGNYLGSSSQGMVNLDASFGVLGLTTGVLTKRIAQGASKKIVGKEVLEETGSTVLANQAARKITTTISENGTKLLNITSKNGVKLEVMIDEVIEGTTMILNKVHIDGAKAGAVGMKEMNEIIKQYGKEKGVKEVIIKGAKRTTGKYKGKVPRPRVIIIDD